MGIDKLSCTDSAGYQPWIEGFQTLGTTAVEVVDLPHCLLAQQTLIILQNCGNVCLPESEEAPSSCSLAGGRLLLFSLLGRNMSTLGGTSSLRLRIHSGSQRQMMTHHDCACTALWSTGSHS